jgi:transcriptional regulator with XRE-family HTH domain
MRKISRMRRLRQLSGQTLDELSIIVSLDRGLLSRAERDLYKLRPEQKAKIAAALSVTAGELFPEDQHDGR